MGYNLFEFEYDENSYEGDTLASVSTDLLFDDESIDNSYDEEDILDKPTSVSDSVLALMSDAVTWEFEGYTLFELLSKTRRAYPYSESAEPIVMLKKSIFPEKDVYLYRSDNPCFLIRISNKLYYCNASPDLRSFGKVTWPVSDEVDLVLEKKHAHFYVWNPSGLYRVFLTRNEVLSIGVCPSETLMLDNIIRKDPRASQKSCFKLTSHSIVEIRTIYPNFCSTLDLAPHYQQQTRNARLLKQLYPDLPVFAPDNYTLYMPYFEQNASLEESIQEIMRVFIQHRRVITDMCELGHFKKDKHHKVYCIAPNLTFYPSVSEVQRTSLGSNKIQQDFILAGAKNSQEYVQFLQARKAHSPEAARLVALICGLLYLVENIEDLFTIEDAWITEPWLQLVSIFSKTNFPITYDDLSLMHQFGSLMRSIAEHPDNKNVKGYEIYYECMKNFITQGNGVHLNIFLSALSSDTINKVFTLCRPHSLISHAVLEQKFTLLSLLLEWHTALISEDSYGYDPIDWAILGGHWHELESFAEFKITNTPAGPYFSLWSTSVNYPHISWKDRIKAMGAWNQSSQFSQRLNTIRGLAFTENNLDYLALVRDLIRNCRTCLFTHGGNFEEQKNVLIKNCQTLLRQKCAPLLNIENQNLMQGAIHDFKNALSSDAPTKLCILM